MLEYDFLGRGTIVDDNDWGRATWHEGRVIARAASKRQEIAIVDLMRFGRSLWLRKLSEEKFWPQRRQKLPTHLPAIAAKCVNPTPRPSGRGIQ